MKRETLETEALKNVCSCFYYELTDNIENIGDNELQRIVNIGWWSHIEQELNEKTNDFYQELSDCPSFTGYASLEQSKINTERT